MRIHILNKKTYSPAFHQPWIDGDRIINVARPSLLGNPFTHDPRFVKPGQGLAHHCVATREEAVACFRTMLNAQRRKNTPIWQEIERIADRIMIDPDQDWGLMCWCAPKACHADVIKSAIEYVIQQRNLHKQMVDRTQRIVPHVWKKHLSNCTPETGCMLCEGGLALCEVCGQAEGDITPSCPGSKSKEIS